MTITNSASCTNVHEIAAGIYRISTPIPPSEMPGGFTFNQFLLVDADLLLHRLGGLALDDAARVSFRMLVESTGEELVAQDAVPFERDAGRVLVACQKHYAVMPPDTLAEVTVHPASGPTRTSTFTILHRFD